MKPGKGSIGRIVDQPSADIRFYLFHGPDEAGSKALAERLRAALKAEKVAVSAATTKTDPAILADEAAAITMFGGPRLIWVEPAGEEIADAVQALLAAGAVESPVVVIAGVLRKTSALLKLGESHDRAIAHASYAPEGRDAARMVVDLGLAEGLVISADIAGSLAGAAGNNQAIIAQELAKFALFLEASPDHPRELDQNVLDLLGADAAEGNLMRLGDLALSGQVEALFAELDRAELSPGEAIPVVRALQRRLLQLAPLRARIEAGDNVDAVMTSMGKALFWKDKPLIQRLLTSWSSERLAAMMDRSAALERGLMLSPEPEVAAVGEELATIGRVAQRRR